MIAILIICCMGFFWGCESDPAEPMVPVGNNNNNNGGNPDGGSNNSSTIKGCQYPVANILDAGSFTLQNGSFKVLNASHTVYQVFGFSFSVAFEGSIKELGISVPENGDYTVRIYDAEVGKDDVLAETVITATNADWTYATIDDLTLSPDLTYVTAIYFKSKPEQQETLFHNISDFQYPAQFGDVTIEAYAINSEIGQMVKPEPKASQAFTIFNGFVDFCFEAS